MGAWIAAEGSARGTLLGLLGLQKEAAAQAKVLATAGDAAGGDEEGEGPPPALVAAAAAEKARWVWSARFEGLLLKGADLAELEVDLKRIAAYEGRQGFWLLFRRS